MKKTIRRLHIPILATALATPPYAWIVIGGILALMIAMILSPGMDDMSMWEALIAGVTRHGVSYVRLCLSPVLCDGYPVMYPPLYVGVFAMFTGLFSLVSHSSGFFTAKYAIFICYLLTVITAGIYGHFVTPKESGRNTVLFAVVMVMTSFSIILNSEALGLVDVFTFPFFILALLFYNRKRYVWFGLLYAVTFLTKWQALLYMPLIVAYLFVTEGYRTVARFVIGLFIGGIGVWAALMFFPLSLFGRSLFSAANHQPISAAPNLPWLSEMLLYRQPFVTLFRVPPDSFPFINTIDANSAGLWIVYWIWKALSVAAYLWVTWMVCRRAKRFVHREGLLVGMVLVTVCYFLLATGAHENHLMLGVISALLVFLTNPDRFSWFMYRSIDLISAFSLFMWDGVTGHPFFPWDPHAVLYPPTVAAVIISGVLVVFVFRSMRASRITGS